MNNYVAIKQIIWKKWTDSWKSSIFQEPEEIEIEPERNRNYEQQNCKH